MADASQSPLAGRRVIVTRAPQQSIELIQALSNRGAIVISLPMISFADPEDFAPLDVALRDLSRFDCLIFTSANAVHSVVARCKTLHLALPKPSKLPRVAVVGPATKEIAEKAGFTIEFTSMTHTGVALARELGDRLQNKRVLLPRSDHANPDLPDALRVHGAKLTEVIAYRTLPPSDTDETKLRQAIGGNADAVLLFSPSAVHHFAESAGPQEWKALQEKLTIVAVGPVTQAALHRTGIDRVVIAADTTCASVVETLEQHFAAAENRASAGVHHA